MDSDLCFLFYFIFFIFFWGGGGEGIVKLIVGGVGTETLKV